MPNNPSVQRHPGRNTLVVCASCKGKINLLQVPATFVVLCLGCWKKLVKRKGET